MIAYIITDSPLGYLLIARTKKGICCIQLGDDKKKMEKEFKKNFIGTEFLKNDKNLRKWNQTLTDYLSGRKPWPRLPYDVQGTPFQQRVWRWLCTIPSGKTYNYSAAAKAIGRPRAVRAVARACASNRAALVIPCHRIVPKAGGVGGYRWRPERKRKLLNIESVTNVNSRSFLKN